MAHMLVYYMYGWTNLRNEMLYFYLNVFLSSFLGLLEFLMAVLLIVEFQRRICWFWYYIYG